MKTRSTFLLAAGSAALITTVSLAGCKTETAAAAPAAAKAGEGAATHADTGRAAPAASGPMVALLTKADWCSICKANGARVTELLGSVAHDGSIEILVNDITDDATAARSNANLAERSLEPVAAGASPGTIAFIDPKTRRRVAEVTVAHQNEEIMMVVGLARSRLSPN